MHTERPSEAATAREESARTVVRTSISITKAAKKRGKDLMEAEGFASFSDMVEYLIRQRSEALAAA